MVPLHLTYPAFWAFGASESTGDWDTDFYVDAARASFSAVGCLAEDASYALAHHSAKSPMESPPPVRNAHNTTSIMALWE